MKNLKRGMIAAALVLGLTFTGYSQDAAQKDAKSKDKKEMKHEMPGGGQGAARPQQPLSPPGSAQATVGEAEITIKYSRPSVRGRKIMGGLVPFGQVWRTGANAATTLETSKDITIGGTKVPAGKYTLHTLPGESAWKLIISKQTTGKDGKPLWGSYDYDQSQDLARVDLKKENAASPVEQFTISIDKGTGNSATLRLEWENTKLTAPITAP